MLLAALFRLRPPGTRSFGGDPMPFLRRQIVRPSVAALAAAESAERNGGGVFLTFWCISLGFACREIDDKFSELVRVAWALA
jgi:hypothetical protein